MVRNKVVGEVVSPQSAPRKDLQESAAVSAPIERISEFEKAASPESLLACYRSGQISPAAWEEHLRDPGLAAYVAGREVKPSLFEDDLPTAELSPCRTWRYLLRRRWGAGPTVGFIMLNPSTADETQDDPTIRRCMGYAKALGAGALVVGNLFAVRSSKPEDLYDFDRHGVDVIGPDNAAALARLVQEVAGEVIICGWGNHGGFMDRGREVRRLLIELGATPMALAVTKQGEPGHPLYLPAALRPSPLPSPPASPKGDGE